MGGGGQHNNAGGGAGGGMYPDSSGDQADIDSCDDKHQGASPQHGHNMPHHMGGGGGMAGVAGNFAASDAVLQHGASGGAVPQFRSPRLPLPLPRNRVVIGGHDHETPL